MTKVAVNESLCKTKAAAHIHKRTSEFTSQIEMRYRVAHIVHDEQATSIFFSVKKETHTHDRITLGQPHQCVTQTPANE